jgi:hypothetical protein
MSCLVSAACCQVWADHSSRGVLPSVVWKAKPRKGNVVDEPRGEEGGRIQGTTEMPDSISNIMINVKSCDFLTATLAEWKINCNHRHSNITFFS